jgi:uncharacterized protein (TIGR00730 family)
MSAAAAPQQPPSASAPSTLADATAHPAKIARLAVFCGSRDGKRPAYAAAAAELGREMAKRRIGLTYGGGTVGLMGVVSRAVLDGFAAEGVAAAPAPPLLPPVLGFIPELLAPRETTGELLGETRVVRDMHERKAAMAEHADAFVALPGGWGTLEEIFEALTWQSLGFHRKPVGLLDTEGFYGGLQSQLQRMVEDDFVKAEVAAQLIVRPTPVELLDALEAWRPPTKTGLELHVDELMLAGSKTAVGVDISKPSGEAE